MRSKVAFPLAAWILVGAILLLSSCASSREWSKADSIRQGAIVALQTVDWHQSRTVATEKWNVGGREYPDYPKWRETNPLLGDHPGRGKVHAYFAAGILSNAAISYILPPKYRAWWQYLSIGVEAGFVAHNLQIGIGW